MTETPTPTEVPDAVRPDGDASRTRSRLVRVLTTRPWVTAVVAVVVIGAGTGGYLTLDGSDTAAATTQVTTSLVSPATGTVRASVSVTGTITAADSTDVSFGSSAEITSVRVAQGDTVTKGEVLGTIDTLALKSTLAQARADLASAQSTLATAQDSSDTSDAQLAADTADVATAKSTVATAVTALADATLRSPITGTVAEVNVAKGDRSSGSGSASTAGGSSGGTGAQSSTGGGGTGAAATTSSTSSTSGDFVVIGMKKWTVSASVDDTQVGLIKKGDQVQLTTDNVTGTVFGVVSSVSVLSSSTSGSATYPVVIAVTGSPAGLHDGASATAAIVYKQATNVLTVPTAAVHTEAGASYVYVSVDGTRTKRAVVTGLASGGTTQIASGLATTDKVVVETVTGGARGTTGGTRQQTGEGGYGRTGYGRTGYGGTGYGGDTGNFPGGGQAPAGGFPGGTP